MNYFKKRQMDLPYNPNAETPIIITPLPTYSEVRLLFVPSKSQSRVWIGWKMSCGSQCGIMQFVKCFRLLCFYVPVHSYCVVETVSSPNSNFQGNLNCVVNQRFVHMLLLVTDNHSRIRKVENDQRNYFMIHLLQKYGD